MNARRLTRIAMFSALAVVSALIRIPIGPVPITLQTLIVLLSGFFLPPLDAAASMLVLLLIRFLMDGPALLLSPSFGFLPGFILAAGVGSLLFRQLQKKPNAWGQTGIFLLMSLLPYATGLPYMAYILNGVNGANMGLIPLLQAGFFPFLIGDLIKAAIAWTIIRLLPAKLQP